MTSTTDLLESDKEVKGTERVEGKIETIVALMYETHGTEMQKEILLAALDSDRIPEEYVEIAFERYNDRRADESREEAQFEFPGR